MTKEEFFEKIAYFNNRIDSCVSISVLQDIECDYRWWLLTFLEVPELHKMQTRYNDDIQAVRFRINDKYEEFRKEIEYEEIED